MAILDEQLRKSKKAWQILSSEGAGTLINRIRMRNKDPLEGQYRAWLAQNSLTEADRARWQAELEGLEYRPLISIVTPVYNVDKIWLEKAVDSVLGQVYPNWELCLVDDASTKEHVSGLLKYFASVDERIKVAWLEQNQGISGASNEALKLASGEFIALMDNDDELSPDALLECVKLLNRHRDADMIYSDEDKISIAGERCEPFFKPDWSPDLLFSQMYTCHLGVYRKSLADAIGGFRKGFEGSQDYDFVLRFVERTDKIHHIPKILYHWRKIPGSTAEQYDVKDSDAPSLKALRDALKRRSVAGLVESGLFPGSYRVKSCLVDEPLVSIIIPTKDKVEYLRRCIDSIKKRSIYTNYEIIVVDNLSEEAETKDYLAALQAQEGCRVLTFDAPFNYAAINNMAAREAAGGVLLFLNNDTELIAYDSLNALLEHALHDNVGAVGAKLVYEDNTIQHAGILMGVGGIANHAFYRMHIGYEHLYFHQDSVVRNYSAVTGACMMVRREVFSALGGFDEENCPIAYNDVDFCLRLGERGYSVVYTPFAVLYHHEAVSRGYREDPEARYMEKRWAGVIANDPFYNPNLARDRFDFSLKL